MLDVKITSENFHNVLKLCIGNNVDIKRSIYI